MKKYIFFHILHFVPVLLGISILSFLLMHIAPGNSVDLRLSAGGMAADPHLVEAMKIEMGLDEPLVIQYINWLSNAVQGDILVDFILQMNRLQ